MSDEATTPKEMVTTTRVERANLEESFALRDEIKQLRILIAVIVRRAGGKMVISNKWLERIQGGDSIIKEDDIENDCIVLTFEGK